MRSDGRYRWLRISSKGGIVLLALAAAAFAAWNTADEAYLLSRVNIIVTAATWIAAPFAIAVFGLRATRGAWILLSLILLAFYTWVFSSYALNGSTYERSAEGAQHMHLVLVPPLLAVMACLVGAVYWLTVMVWDWLAAKRLAPG